MTRGDGILSILFHAKGCLFLRRGLIVKGEDGAVKVRKCEYPASRAKSLWPVPQSRASAGRGKHVEHVVASASGCRQILAPMPLIRLSCRVFFLSPPSRTHLCNACRSTTGFSFDEA